MQRSGGSMDLMFQPFRKFLDFEGRARRKEYWLFVLLVLGAAAASLGLAMVGQLIHVLPLQHGGVYLVVAILAVSFLPWTALRVRRLHDTNRSGWWIFLGAIPYLGSFVLLIFMVLDGTPGRNSFGRDPKRRGETPLGVFD